MLPKNRQPTHPGEMLLEEFLKPLRLSQGQFVKHLGGSWTQPKISEIINKRRRVTEAIALDFADAFGNSPEFWLNLQNRYDLWLACQTHKRIRRWGVKNCKLPRSEIVPNFIPNDFLSFTCLKHRGTEDTERNIYPYAFRAFC